jgi:hypothetical protein
MTKYRNDIECPYCGHPQDINHDDGYGYSEDRKHEQQCTSCDKHFAYVTSIIYSYEAFKADCLNDNNHDWKPTTTIPKEHTQMKCSICDERREPTPAEKIQYNIPPTIQDQINGYISLIVGDATDTERRELLDKEYEMISRWRDSIVNLQDLTSEQQHMIRRYLDVPKSLRAGYHIAIFNERFNNKK